MGRAVWKTVTSLRLAGFHQYGSIGKVLDSLYKESNRIEPCSLQGILDDLVSLFYSLLTTGRENGLGALGGVLVQMRVRAGYL